MKWHPAFSSDAMVREAVAALGAHRLRTSLSAIGIVFGVATVVASLAVAEGARREALSEIGSLGINNVFLRAVPPPASRKRPNGGGAPVLTLTDVQAIRDTLDNADAIAATRSVSAEISVEGRRSAGYLVGVTPEWHVVSESQLSSGRWLLNADDITRRRVAILGASLAAELFGGIPPAGARVSAAGNWYSVVGSLRARANTGVTHALQSVDTDRAVLVPLETMDVSLGEHDSIDRVQEIGVRLRGPAEVNRAAQSIAALAARRHASAPHFELVVPRELLRARLAAQRTFHVVLIAIGALALLISGIGIMNIMLASVVERTQEIGVRRAVGATRADIVKQFGFEASVLCVAGGVAGIPLGAVFSAVVAITGDWPVSISVGSVVLALALAASVGITFGLYPARVAACIEPIDALRSS